MKKSTSIKSNEVTFTNTSEKGNMNFFWINAFIKNEEPSFLLSINGRHTSVSGRYDQAFSIEDAKDIVSFLTKKIKEAEKTRLNNTSKGKGS